MYPSLKTPTIHFLARDMKILPISSKALTQWILQCGYPYTFFLNVPSSLNTIPYLNLDVFFSVDKLWVFNPLSSHTAKVIILLMRTFIMFYYWKWLLSSQQLAAYACEFLPSIFLPSVHPTSQSVPHGSTMCFVPHIAFNSLKEKTKWNLLIKVHLFLKDSEVCCI